MATNMQNNTTSRLQTFYAADGVMTILSQELFDNKFETYRSPNLLMMDNFNRPDSTALGNQWVEVEDKFENTITLREEALVFKSISSAKMRPLLKTTFPIQKTGRIIWSFNMNWASHNVDNNYEILMQMGYNMNDSYEFTNVAASLRWGDQHTFGFSSNESFGYRNALKGKQLAIINQNALIKVDVNLNTRKYDIYLNNRLLQKGISFTTPVTAVNQIRFFTDRVSTCKFTGLSFDNVIVYKEANYDSVYTDTFKFSNGQNVEWAVECEDPNKYVVHTNAFKDGSKINNMLDQVLNIAPHPALSSYPYILKTPVRFYDFHSNRTNIEFEQPYDSNDPEKNTVAYNLNMDAKPMRGSRIFFNYYIQYWFVDSKTINPIATVDKYETTLSPANPCHSDPDYENHIGEFTSNRRPNSMYGSLYAKDAFANIVIDSTLPFRHVSNGTYIFEEPEFFYLDNRGFGAEFSDACDCKLNGKPRRNHCFSMEMHRPFLKTPGLSFEFTGDDDVFLFINDKLVIDLGGIHGAKNAKVLVDTIAGLQNNTFYNFDFFYCDRHSYNSSIKITTNMLDKTTPVKPKKFWRRDYGTFF
jgi:fibro-slime domain-containing protein